MNAIRPSTYLIVLLLLWSACLTQAQNYPGAEQTPEFTVDEFEAWIDTLPNVSGDEREAMRGVHALYLEQHEAGFQRFIDAYNATAGMEGKAAKRRDIYTAWYRERDALRDRILDDLRIILDESTRPHVDRLDRRLRRIRVESLYIVGYYQDVTTSNAVFDDAQRAELSPGDREAAERILEQYAVQRDALCRRLEMELRAIVFDRFVDRTGPEERERFRQAYLKALSYKPLFTEPLVKARTDVMQALSPEGKLAWRLAELQRIDPTVFVNSPVDTVRAALTGIDSPRAAEVSRAAESAIARFLEQRTALRLKILQAGDAWEQSGEAAKAKEEREELIKRIQRGHDPTADPRAPLLRDPRLVTANELIILELATLRQLDAMIPDDLQRSLPVEARLLLRWGRRAPER